MFFHLQITLILSAAVALAEPPPETIEVTKVIDGDTFTGRDERGTDRKFRMAGIDAPESKQPYGVQSRQALTELIGGQQIRIIARSTDRYQRTVADVWVDSLHVNRELVIRGHAWWYSPYSPDDRELRDAEDLARRERSGLWAGDNPLAPWLWRKPE